MAASSPQDTIRQINSGAIAPLYYLTGKEKFFHDQVIEALIANSFQDKGSRDLNLSLLYGTENTLAELLNAITAYPMLAKTRLVIVREFNRMKISNGDSLENYLQQPIATTCLVLSAEDKGSGKLHQLLMKEAVHVECRPVPEFKLANWIRQYYKQYGTEIEPQAAEYLVSHCGTNLLFIDQELKKIKNYKGDENAVSVQDLEMVTGISREENVFALQKALGQRQLNRSLKIAKALLDSGENIQVILAVLFAHFKKAYLVAALKQQNLNNADILKLSGLSEFQLKDINRTLQHFNLLQLEQVFGLLHRTDFALKTSTANDHAALQILSYKICSLK